MSGNEDSVQRGLQSPCHSAFTDDVTTWEGFRTRMFAAQHRDNRTVNAVLYFLKLFLSLAV